MLSRHSGRAFATDSFVGPSFAASIPSGPFVADFCCSQRKLVVELDGGHHAVEIAADEKRSQFLEFKGYRVLRFWNHDVLKDTVAVLERIAEVLGDPHPSPLPERAREKKQTRQSRSKKPTDENS
jgi:adenine-specific DNA-methyltransferase